jgi:hypothetical protein
VVENGVNSNRISQMIAAGRIVRNDEVVGSIPTSSTKSSIIYKFSASTLVPLRPIKPFQVLPGVPQTSPADAKRFPQDAWIATRNHAVCRRV